jgi:hypothetical protein
LRNLTSKHGAEATYDDLGGGGFCYEPFGSPGPVMNGGPTDLLTVPAGYLLTSNLQLYQCAVGCRPGTTVLAWTHDGVWRYTTIN